MSKKEELLHQLGESYGYLEESISSRIELAKLVATEKSAKVLSGFIMAIVVVIALVFCLFCLVVAGGFALVSLTGSTALAFLLMAFFFFTLTLVLYFFRNSLILTPVINMVIKKIYPGDEQ